MKTNNKNMINQRTLKNSIKAFGVGVHTGTRVSLELRPAPLNTGIVFCRTDFKTPIYIKACEKNVGDVLLSTSLVSKNIRISTIEHIMSAFAGLGIDNAYVYLDAPEVPIMDGSASAFIFLIQSAGIKEQNSPKKFIRIKERVEVKEQDKKIILEPFDGIKVSFAIAFDHPVFKGNEQFVEIDFATSSFVKEISRARTFGFMSDFKDLRGKNLALGASLNNSIAIDEDQVLNEDGLRYENEFVRHKILDAMGDLFLLGHNFIGAFYGYKSGHSLNNLLLKKLLSKRQSWEIVTFEEDFQEHLLSSEMYAL